MRDSFFHQKQRFLPKVYNFSECINPQRVMSNSKSRACTFQIVL